MYQWLIQGGYPSLFLDQAEARVAEVIFFRPGPPSSQGLDDWASPSLLPNLLI